MDEAFINLKTSPLTDRFFQGWAPQKAIAFAQKLLVIGIGVAYKLLDGNTPEEAFMKLNKMAENVISEYGAGKLPKQIQEGTNVNKQEEDHNEKRHSHSRKKQFIRNQQQESFDFKEVNQQSKYFEGGNVDPSLKQLKLQEEINIVKKKLDSLNSKLSGLPNQEKIQFALKQEATNKRNTNPLSGEEDLMLSQELLRGRGRQSRLQSPVTPKITSSPSPFQNWEIQRNMIPNNRSHLNDDAVKLCMKIEGDDNYQDEYLNQQQPFTEEVYNENYLSHQKGQYSSSPFTNNFKENSNIQQSKSPQKHSDAFIKSSDTIFKQKQINNNNASKNIKGQLPNRKDIQHKEKLSSKEIGNNYSKKSVVPSFQDGAQKKVQYNHVESRIKNAVQAHREQHFTATDNQREEEEEPEQTDFRKILRSEKKGEDRNQIKNQEGITFELGVQFSKEAQKKFYEKQKMNKKIEESQKKQQTASNQKKKSTYSSLQTYPIVYNSQQQQQFYKNLEEQQQFDQFQPQAYQLKEEQSKSLREIQVGSQISNTQQGKKNILDIANSFLQNPLMRKLNEDERSSTLIEDDDGYSQNYNYKDINPNTHGNINSFPSQLQSSKQLNPYNNLQIQEQMNEYPNSSLQNSQEDFYQGTMNHDKMLEGFRQPKNYEVNQYSSPQQQEQPLIGGYPFESTAGSNLSYQNFQQSKRHQKQQTPQQNLIEQNKRENIYYNNPDHFRENQEQAIEIEGQQSGLLPVKYNDIFRESINNSDFTMPNEEIQQFFKNQNFNIK